MTRFGMGPEEFKVLAQLIRDAIAGSAGIQEKVIQLRRKYVALKYCFKA